VTSIARLAVRIHFLACVVIVEPRSVVGMRIGFCGMRFDVTLENVRKAPERLVIPVTRKEWGMYE